eukprot:CAMPEP_0202443244 /NCGR_PEP_ID=MMETSP1360-20130828/2585_1 /ASSEMBLY_ACC=CAM_ASM_000848 /TAXON_ID=515479 /ORGANISM="Licmophora paradoxa, Strain CCMP2313" /LENGTH=280 /DNA_ID=CAMNT_0049058893 /DNA_START=113 /DNA_END=955 /DNA_ORIENTATION=-
MSNQLLRGAKQNSFLAELSRVEEESRYSYDSSAPHQDLDETTRTFGSWRILEGNGGNYTNSSDPTMTTDAPVHDFSSLTFWSVNSIWMTVLGCSIIFFWKCNGAQRLQEWTDNSNASDREYAIRRYQRRMRAEEAKKVTPEKRLKTLKKVFRDKKVLMIVTEKDLSLETGTESGDGNNDSMDMDFSTHKTLIIPTSQGDRIVPDCCAVCLGSYDIGETVVWSTNKECSHAFHEECVTDWLIKMQDGNPCPCCRQCFVLINEDDQANNKTLAMNLDAVRFF